MNLSMHLTMTRPGSYASVNNTALALCVSVRIQKWKQEVCPQLLCD